MINDENHPKQRAINDGVVLIVRSQESLIGLWVDTIDAVCGFDKAAIRTMNNLMHCDGGYVKSLVHIPESTLIGKMLVILDQNLLLQTVRNYRPSPATAQKDLRLC